MRTTMDVGQRLAELVQAGRNRAAIEELYADDAVAVEAMEDAPMGREVVGKAALLEYADWFFRVHEVHGQSVDGPFPHDDRFICILSIDLTATEGPMEGQRFQMKEAAVYTVTNGHIVRSEFFYGHGTCDDATS
ncbi:MAG: nuclear transport factor 2 family protein [Planctomycetota bacterium]